MRGVDLGRPRPTFRVFRPPGTPRASLPAALLPSRSPDPRRALLPLVHLPACDRELVGESRGAGPRGGRGGIERRAPFLSASSRRILADACATPHPRCFESRLAHAADRGDGQSGCRQNQRRLGRESGSGVSAGAPRIRGADRAPLPRRPLRFGMDADAAPVRHDSRRLVAPLARVGSSPPRTFPGTPSLRRESTGAGRHSGLGGVRTDRRLLSGAGGSAGGALCLAQAQRARRIGGGDLPRGSGLRTRERSGGGAGSRPSLSRRPHPQASSRRAGDAGSDPGCLWSGGLARRRGLSADDRGRAPAAQGVPRFAHASVACRGTRYRVPSPFAGGVDLGAQDRLGSPPRAHQSHPRRVLFASADPGRSLYAFAGDSFLPPGPSHSLPAVLLSASPFGPTSHENLAPRSRGCEGKCRLHLQDFVPARSGRRPASGCARPRTHARPRELSFLPFARSLHGG